MMPPFSNTTVTNSDIQRFKEMGYFHAIFQMLANRLAANGLAPAAGVCINKLNLYSSQSCDSHTATVV